MEKYKCESCDDSFRTDLQLRKHFGIAHPAVKTVIVEEEPPEIQPVLNVRSGEMVTWDPFKHPKKKLKPTDVCVSCGKKAYTLQANSQPICYGLWATWGCHYTKDMIDFDRKFWHNPMRNRNTYISRVLNKKERKKMVKQIAELEREVWAEMSWTPIEEIEKYHDDKLRTEVRMLERVREVQC